MGGGGLNRGFTRIHLGPDVQVKTLDKCSLRTLFFSSVDNLSLARCVSTFVIGYWAI